jgi:hypothetical protein
MSYFIVALVFFAVGFVVAWVKKDTIKKDVQETL